MPCTTVPRAFSGICVLTFLLAQGCGTTPEAPVAIDEEIRGSLGTVGILSIGPAPMVEALGPIGAVEERRQGARRGIAYGAGGGALAGLGLGLLCGPFVVICSPSFALAGALGGGIAGGITGAYINSGTALPDATEQDLVGALDGAIASRDVRTLLTGQIYEFSNTDSDFSPVNLGQADPGSSETGIDYETFASRGIDTLLEIGVAQVAMVRDDDRETEFFLLINVYLQLTRLSDQEVVWVDNQVVYLSESSPVLRWSSVGSDLARTELDNGLELLATEISSIVFDGG